MPDVADSKIEAAPEVGTPAIGLKLRMIGFHIPPPSTPEQSLSDLLVIRRGLATGRLDPSKLSAPVAPTAVFADPAGKTYTIGINANGETVARAANLSDRSLLTDSNDLTGSFISHASLATATNQAKASPSAPSVSGLIAAALMQSLIGAMSPGTSGAAGNGSAGTTSVAAATLSLSANLVSKLTGMAESQAENSAATVLANLISGSSLTSGVLPELQELGNSDDIGKSLQGLGGDLAGLGISEALDMVGQSVVSSLFPTDDRSSSLQFLEAAAAKKLMSELESEVMGLAGSFLKNKATDAVGESDSLGKQLNAMLGNVPPGLPLARTGDVTSHGGTIVGGTVKTVVGGAAVARVGDLQYCPIPGPPPHGNGPILHGNNTIQIEGAYAAGYTHDAICEGCGAITTLIPLMSDVQIGSVNANLPQTPIDAASNLAAPASQMTGTAATATAVSPSREVVNAGLQSTSDSVTGDGVLSGLNTTAGTANGPDPTPVDDTVDDPDTDTGATRPPLSTDPNKGNDYFDALKVAPTPEDAIAIALGKNGGDTGAADLDIVLARNDQFGANLAAAGDSLTFPLTRQEVDALEPWTLVYADAFLESAHGSEALGWAQNILNTGYMAQKFWNTYVGTLSPTDQGSSYPQSPFSFTYLAYADMGFIYAEAVTGKAGFSAEKLRQAIANASKSSP